MTLQELGHIDELIAWLDNEQDGAEDAGFVARSATNWHPALVALKSEYADLIRRHAEVVAQLRGMVGAYRVACQIDPNETEDHAGHPLAPDYLEARAWLASEAALERREP